MLLLFFFLLSSLNSSIAVSTSSSYSLLKRSQKAAFSPPRSKQQQHCKQRQRQQQSRSTAMDDASILVPFSSMDVLSPSSSNNNKNNNNNNEDNDVLMTVSPPVPKRHHRLGLTELALAGAIAAFLGDVAVHPMDTIKTLQQSTEGAGLDLMDAANVLWRGGGPQALYRGCLFYAIADGLGSSMKLVSYENMKKWASQHIPDQDMNKALYLCAALAFLTASVVAVPGELVKQRMQMGQLVSSSSSIFDGIFTICRTDGWKGLFVGYFGVCFRDLPYTTLELGMYDNLKKICRQWKTTSMEQQQQSAMIVKYEEIGLIHGKEMKKNKNSLFLSNQMDEIVAAAITGGVAGYITTPFDVIKTKLMVDNAEGIYDNFLDCWIQTVDQYGPLSLFDGGMARVMWLMPFTAIYLPLYESFKRLGLQWKNMNS